MLMFDEDRFLPLFPRYPASLKLTDCLYDNSSSIRSQIHDIKPLDLHYIVSVVSHTLSRRDINSWKLKLMETFCIPVGDVDCKM